jgi:NADH:ubiquinone oxidoreductase subunit 4 (subunit M)
VVATAGVVIAAVYLLWAYQQVFHGEPTEEDTTTADLTVNQRLIVAPLIVLIVLLGVFPKPVLDRITRRSTASSSTSTRSPARRSRPTCDPGPWWPPRRPAS